tara:strand:- start:117 stop:614 length:498 start_codon:yes stop_codon:yes gene_type:complete
MGIISNGTTILDNGSITDGVVDTAELINNSATDVKIASGINANRLTGALPAIDGSNLTNVSSDPFAADSITTSNRASGYVRFVDGGYTIQWGTTSGPGESPKTVSFPTTFTNVYSITFIGADNGTTLISVEGNISSDGSTSGSSFSLRSGGSIDTIYWWATGRIT